MDIDDIDITELVKKSPLLARLVEEVRLEWDEARNVEAYNRMHNRHNRSGRSPYNRMHNRHNRS